MDETRLEALVRKKGLELKWEQTETTTWEDGPRVFVLNSGSRSKKLGLQSLKGFSVCDVRGLPVDFSLSDYAQLALAFLSHQGYLGDRDTIGGIDSISFRSGAGLRPVRKLGVYALDNEMIADLKEPTFKHDSNSDGLVAHILSRMGERGNIPCYTRDLITTDQLDVSARFSGLPEVQVECRAHFLNMTAALREVLRQNTYKGIEFDEMDALVVHLGGGIGIAGFRNGRYMDFADAAGEMPSETRAGGIHLNPLSVAKYVARNVLEKRFSHEGAQKWVVESFMKNSGLKGYLNTADVKTIAEISTSPEKAKAHYETNRGFFQNLFLRCGDLPKGVSCEEAVQNLANNALDSLVYNIEAGIGKIYGGVFKFQPPRAVIVTGNLLYQPAIERRIFRDGGAINNLNLYCGINVEPAPGQQEMKSLLWASIPDLEESCGGPGKFLSYAKERYNPRNLIFVKRKED